MPDHICLPTERCIRIYQKHVDPYVTPTLDEALKLLAERNWSFIHHQPAFANTAFNVTFLNDLNALIKFTSRFDTEPVTPGSRHRALTCAIWNALLLSHNLDMLTSPDA